MAFLGDLPDLARIHIHPGQPKSPNAGRIQAREVSELANPPKGLWSMPQINVLARNVRQRDSFRKMLPIEIEFGLILQR